MSQANSKTGGNIHQTREVKIHLPVNFTYRNLYPESIIIEEKKEEQS